jgi:hypothetical protein
MNCTTSENEELLEQVTVLIAGYVKEQVRKEPEQGIGEIEEGMRHLLQEVGRRALGRSITELDKAYPQTEACACGGEAPYVARRRAKALTVFGWISYRRAYHLCPACHQGQSPLDRRLRLRPGQVSPGLHPLLALLGVQTSFAEASKMAQQLLLLEVSDNTIRQETQRVGQRRQEQEQVWQEQSQDYAYFQDRQRQEQAPRRLYGSIDGVSVRLEEEWRELRAGCWYEVAPVSARQWPSRYKQRVGELEGLKAENITYYCDIAEWRTFADLAWTTGCQRRADVAQELVFVADGAHWIWQLVELNFPQAVPIVDWYHAVAYLTPFPTLSMPGYWAQASENLRWR